LKVGRPGSVDHSILAKTREVVEAPLTIELPIADVPELSTFNFELPTGIGNGGGLSFVRTFDTMTPSVTSEGPMREELIQQAEAEAERILRLRGYL
jgi:hypothetical protein